MVGDINVAAPGETLDDSLNTIISQIKLLAQEKPGQIKATADPLKLMPHTGLAVNLLNYQRVVALDLENAVDMTQAAQLGDDLTPYTPAEIGVQTILAGSALRRSADPNLRRNAAKILFNGYELKEDGDGATQFSSWGPTIGAAATVASPGHLNAVEAILRIGNSRSDAEPAPDPLFLVHNPLPLGVIGGRLLPLSSVPRGDAAFGVAGGANAGVTVGPGINGFTPQLMKQGLIRGWKQYGGMAIVGDANVEPDGDDDAVGSGHSKEGLKFVSEVPPHLVPDTSDKSMRDAVELNYWGSSVWGLYRSGAYGVAVTFEAVIPSS